MDKVDMLDELAMQRRADGITLVRRLRDEAKAIIAHLDLIDDQASDMEWTDLPAMMGELPDALTELKRVEQRLLRIHLALDESWDDE